MTDTLTYPQSNFGTSVNRKQLIYENYFSELYDKYSPTILGLIIKNGISQDEGEQILIKVFLRAWDDVQTIASKDRYPFTELLKITCLFLNIKRVL